MKAWLLSILLSFGSMATAQTISVQSGEHDGYTRLVMSFPKLGDWTLVREPEGYSLTISGSKPDYDLSAVFRRIAQDRLSAISADPNGGALKLSVACACFAMPFELQKGLLVIDIKDGVAPEGSSFELAQDGTISPPLQGKSTALPDDRTNPKPALTEPLQNGPASLSDAVLAAARLRVEPNILDQIESTVELGKAKEDLLWQLSKGVAEGVVEMSNPFVPMTAQLGSESTQTNMRIGADVGIVPNAIMRKIDRMTGSGDSCILDPQLDIGAWGDAGDVMSGIAAQTTSLVGEFDHPDDDAIARTVRFYLSLGFGAEARLVLNAFKVSPPDRAIWETMSHILDLEVPPGDVFANMHVCDTSAALWSILSSADTPPPNQIAIPAVLRSFSALPVHLRRLLGPELASRFLARNDAVTARAIRDSILRAPGDPGDRVHMLEAEIALSNGQTALAEGILLPLSGGSGPLGLRSAATLIQTQVAAGEDVSIELTTTAESLLHEARGGEEEALLTSALALGYASQNRFGDAFDLVASGNLEAAPIWEVLAERGNDDSVLRWALLQKTEVPPALAAPTTLKIAQHLLSLGFPDRALQWINAKILEAGPKDEQLILLAAEAEMSLNNFPRALSLLDGLQGESAVRLRANVFAGMGAKAAVADLTQSGQSVEAANHAKQTRDWSGLNKLEQGGIWQDATALIQQAEATGDALDSVAPSPVPATAELGPLAQTRAALEESAAARAVIDQLLAGADVQGVGRE